MARRNLFNMDRESELYKGLMGAYKALIRGATFMFRKRECPTRVNSKNRAYIDIPAYFTVQFRVYQPDNEGKSVVMAIVKDMFANAGERDGKTMYDNPVLWGRIMRTAETRSETLFFFNDPTPREAIAELKQALVSKGLVDPAAFEMVDVEQLDRTRAPVKKVAPPSVKKTEA